MGIDADWLNRYDSAGLRDTGFYPRTRMSLLLLNSRGPFYPMTTLTQDGRYYLFGGNNTIIRCLPDGRPDSTWGGDGRVDSVLMQISSAFSGSDGRLHVLGKYVYNGSDCALMSLSSRGAKNLVTTIKGWLVSPCGKICGVEPNSFAVLSANYTTNAELNIRWLLDMSTARPGFGKNGRASVKVDTLLTMEPESLHRLADGTLLAFWRRYTYDYDDNRSYYKDYWSGVTLMDSTGKPYSNFGKRGSAYLIPQSQNQYAVRAVEVLPDQSVLALADIWNSGAYSAMLMKFKPVDTRKLAMTSRVRNRPVLQMQVSPNPASHQLQVNGANISKLVITDMAGRVLQVSDTDRQVREHLLDLRLGPGVYLLHAYSDSVEYTATKLIVR